MITLMPIIWIVTNGQILELFNLITQGGNNNNVGLCENFCEPRFYFLPYVWRVIRQALFFVE
jgi:hypothetical protein